MNTVWRDPYLLFLSPFIYLVLRRVSVLSSGERFSSRDPDRCGRRCFRHRGGTFAYHVVYPPRRRRAVRASWIRGGHACTHGQATATRHCPMMAVPGITVDVVMYY